MKFADFENPTEAELREWAADPIAGYPDEMEQDWDLMVAEWTRVDLITELAADPSCPKRGFFLAVLYLMAGDCVRQRAGNTDIPHLRALLERLKGTDSQPLQLFRTRAESLLAEPSKFNYANWCDGGYARGTDTHGAWCGFRPRSFTEGVVLAAIVLFLMLVVGLVVYAIIAVVNAIR